MFKKILIGMVVILFALCNIASDWKECKSELIMANTTDTKMIYHVAWIDHDVEEFKGRLIPRAGGEVQPYSFGLMSSDFRLCPGRHVVTWWNPDKESTRYFFLVTKDTTQVVLTPTESIVK